MRKAGIEPRSAALEADVLAIRPTRRLTRKRWSYDAMWLRHNRSLPAVEEEGRFGD